MRNPPWPAPPRPPAETPKRSEASHGRHMLRAVAHATGIERLRSASVAADYDDITLVTVTFIASEAQVKAMGEFLAREGEADTRSA